MLCLTHGDIDSILSHIPGPKPYFKSGKSKMVTFTQHISKQPKGYRENNNTRKYFELNEN